MLTSEQLRASRAILRWDQSRLAEGSGVSAETIKRLEKMDGPLGSTRVDTIDKLRRTLEAAGVEFIAENGGGAGVRLRRNTDQTMASEARKAAVVMREHKASKGAGNDPQRGAAALERFAHEVGNVHGAPAKPDGS